MTAKEYLGQAYRLNEKINTEQREVDNLRRLATSLSSPQLGDKVKTSHPTEAPFVQYINALVDLEKDITAKIDSLVALRVDISRVINAVPDDNERLVLHMRYLDNFTWEQIAGELCVASSTVRRWHNRGLQHASIPG
jgi:DNA-directed RNA polymerase specialized sigma24 family protein